MGEGERDAGHCFARIDLAAAAANFREAQRLAGPREVIAAVKADAYGHGAAPFARRLAEVGCRRFAVLSVAEAAALREAGIRQPILVLAGVLDPAEATRAVELFLTPVLHHRPSLDLAAAAARRAGERLAVHVEVDTGMGRMGIPADPAVDLWAAVADEPSLALEGVFTHFALADDPDLAFSLSQLARFREVLAEAEARGLPRPPLVHADNSGALLSGAVLSDALPEATAVRPGIMLYGVNPAPHLDPEGRLQPVMSLRARVAAIRPIAAGATVGYGATFRAKRATRVATVRIGYADAYPRDLGNAGRVWLAGALYPVVGRVSMDYVGVDIGDAPVEVGDEAVLFGPPEPTGAPPLRVEDLAEMAGTIANELLVRIGARVPRVFVG